MPNIFKIFHILNRYLLVEFLYRAYVTEQINADCPIAKGVNAKERS